MLKILIYISLLGVLHAENLNTPSQFICDIPNNSYVLLGMQYEGDAIYPLSLCSTSETDINLKITISENTLNLFYNRASDHPPVKSELTISHKFTQSHIVTM